MVPLQKSPISANSLTCCKSFRMDSIARQPIQFDRGPLSDDQLIQFYRSLLRPRRIEEKMLKLLRQGKISKWFSGIGQEAIAVGVTAALQPEELIFTMHRNLGVFTSREVPLARLFAQWQGKPAGFTKGRDRSFHFGTLQYGIVGMISHLGPQLALADGVGLAARLSAKREVTVAFTGEGGTSEGDFHEALNVASVWQLPVIFVVENNGYGLSTPVQEQYRCQRLSERGAAYGMRACTIDGNNVLEVYQTMHQLAGELRDNPEPVLLECQTFRMRGHEEASGTKYVPQELMDTWSARDPLSNFEHYLQEQGLLGERLQAALEQEVGTEIEAGLNKAYAAVEVTADAATEARDVYAPAELDYTGMLDHGLKRKLRFVDAISGGLRQAMERHDNLILMGQDIAEYGGVFKVTDGFVEAFGRDRVRNTPLCESAIVGTGLGLSLRGYKSMIEMQFADFVTCGFNQIVNNLAKIHYRWGQAADVVIRMPTGGGVNAGPFHSQSNEAWFFHTPGLRIFYPSNPADAKGLLLSAFEDPNPVLFFEHKGLYRKLSAEVPDAYYTLQPGQAALLREGAAVSIITYGMGVHWAMDICAEEGLDADILDLRTLQPLDMASIGKTVRKTGKVLVLHEDTLTGGIGGELAARIGEQYFEHLDAPVVRVASADTPVPFAPALEQTFLPVARLREKLHWLLDY